MVIDASNVDDGDGHGGPCRANDDGDCVDEGGGRDAGGGEVRGGWAGGKPGATSMCCLFLLALTKGPGGDGGGDGDGFCDGGGDDYGGVGDGGEWCWCMRVCMAVATVDDDG